MAFGARVRSLFGPLEAPVTDLYRAFFVDLHHQIRQVTSWVPAASDILEIGCGEGAIAQRLAATYPTAFITGIDISPRAGRLFQGDRRRVSFHTRTAARHAESGERYDLILMCDVLHHVPWDQHEVILNDAKRMLKPGGSFILKDWELIPNLGHSLCEFSDRVLTGDDVRFGTRDDFQQLLTRVFGGVKGFARIRPWRNNIIFHA
jgi:2-polyprenyl-6-hydroxyphenyl methylase/3-demethylubiquinone-9 3-methyltransferase